MWIKISCSIRFEMKEKALEGNFWFFWELREVFVLLRELFCVWMGINPLMLLQRVEGLESQIPEFIIPFFFLFSTAVGSLGLFNFLAETVTICKWFQQVVELSTWKISKWFFPPPFPNNWGISWSWSNFPWWRSLNNLLLWSALLRNRRKKFQFPG